MIFNVSMLNVNNRFYMFFALFKKGETDDSNNYRPISVLPIAMKVFEKVVHRQGTDF